MALRDEFCRGRNTVAMFTLGYVLAYRSSRYFLHRHSLKRRPFAQSGLLLFSRRECHSHPAKNITEIPQCLVARRHSITTQL